MYLALSGFSLTILSLLAFIIIIGIIIIFHEFGHFIVARKSGITCTEFSIGMGPSIYQKETKSTKFSIRAIPLGGYVSMATNDLVSDLVKVGEKIRICVDDDLITKIILDDKSSYDYEGTVIDFDLEDKDGNGMYITLDIDFEEQSYKVYEKALYILPYKETIEVTPHKDTFEGQKTYKRLFTLLAGSFMNFILAILIYLIYFSISGVPNYNSNIIGAVEAGYSAENILEVGDEILKVNDNDINSWYEFQDVLSNYNNDLPDSLNITIKRQNEEIILDIPYSIIINSIGLSNLQVDTTKFPNINEGIYVGNTAITYLDNKNIKYPLTNGDIITKVRVDKLIDNKTPIKGEEIIITSWDQLINNLNDVDVANIYFEYYSQEKAKVHPDDPIVKISDSYAVRSWGNETLVSQNIEKISLKLGISPTYHYDFIEVIKSTFSQFYSDFTLVFRTLKLLIAPSGIRQVGVKNLSSVVGIFDMVQKILIGGFLPLLAFTAMLSINIGIMNLLPLPVLDGGRIVFVIYEMITGKRPNKKFENILNTIFVILLLILFLFVTFNDITRLIR